MKTLLSKNFAAIIVAAVFITTAHAQNIFPSTGRTGIYTTSPITSLQVKGGARIGTAANYVNIDSATGQLSFAGTGVYQVAGNKYAFQFTGNPNYGLFFNSSSVQYEFRNGSAVPVFSINANTGNSVFNGILKVGAYTLPATDGTSGQLLKTNGAGVLTWSADNNNIYTAGAGVSISSNVITNSAPDKTVVLTAGSGISVTGTYPNFTIANTISKGWSLTGNGGTDSSINFIGTTDAHPLVFRVNNIKAGIIDYNKANTGFGFQSLFSNTTGSYNCAIGTQTLLNNTFGNQNTAIGYEALELNNTGSGNVANGFQALGSNTSGYANNAAGYQSLYNNKDGHDNTGVGYSALFSNISGTGNTGTGNFSLYSNTGSSNSASGYQALFHNTNGNNNTANGYASLFYNTAGNGNTANGFFALFNNTTGYSNVAIGTAALYQSTNAHNFVAVGDSALYNQGPVFDGGEFPSPGNNSAFGSKALFTNVSGQYNTATGFESLYYNTGSSNTANGTSALYSNHTGSGNSAFGASALEFSVDGSGNTATGGDALKNNADGNNNTATGESALTTNNNGSQNTADGAGALSDNEADNNTAIGYSALYSNSFSTNLVAVGSLALYNNGIGAVQPSDGIANTAVGYQSLYNNTTGYNNTSIGVQALSTNTTGYNNTAIGVNADVSSNTYSNSTAVGVLSTITGSNQVRVGSIGSIYGTDPTSIGGKVSFTALSDGRVKKNIKENVPGLVFINKLKPITYNIDNDAINKIVQRPAIKDKDGKTMQPSADEIATRKAEEQVVHTGFIAQDVEKAAKSLNYDFSGVDAAKNSKDLYGLRYAEFVVPLVKAVQELSTENDSLKNENSSLRKDFNDLKALVLSIQQQQQSCSLCSAAVNNAGVTQSYAVITDAASLQQNIPNPFTNNTTIGYSLPQKITSAQIIITDKSGKTLKAITISGSGKGSLTVNASTLSSGAYQYSLIVDGRLIDTKQMVLAK